jgi:hypothetical protein
VSSISAFGYSHQEAEVADVTYLVLNKGSTEVDDHDAPASDVGDC